MFLLAVFSVGTKIKRKERCQHSVHCVVVAKFIVFWLQLRARAKAEMMHAFPYLSTHHSSFHFLLYCICMYPISYTF